MIKHHSNREQTLNQIEVRDYSLKIHKSAYHLFSVFISKRGFSFMQTRETFREIFEWELPLPEDWHKTFDDALPLHILNKLHNYYATKVLSFEYQDCL